MDNKKTPKTVFISQPMKGKSSAKIHGERIQAIKELKSLLKDEELIFIDSFIKEEPPEDNPTKGLWYLGESLKIMSQADIVYFARGHEDAPGCLLEKLCALNYGKNVYTYNSPRLISEGRPTDE